MNFTEKVLIAHADFVSTKISHQHELNIKPLSLMWITVNNFCFLKIQLNEWFLDYC